MAFLFWSSGIVITIVFWIFNSSANPLDFLTASAAIIAAVISARNATKLNEMKSDQQIQLARLKTDLADSLEKKKHERKVVSHALYLVDAYQNDTSKLTGEIDTNKNRNKLVKYLFISKPFMDKEVNEQFYTVLSALDRWKNDQGRLGVQNDEMTPATEEVKALQNLLQKKYF